MKRLFCALISTVFAAVALAQGAPEITRFSSAKAGGPLPGEWKHVPLASFKNNTEYSLVSEDGATVLQATAHNSASFLAIKAEFDPKQFPMLSWRWKVKQGIPAANTAEQSKEDSPARIMIAFDGDMSKLSAKDRFASTAAKSISGQALPYATLMYVWGEKVAADSITTSSRSARIKMLAVSADETGIGQWQSHSRNLVQDFKRAFGEEPGKVLSIEVMTDTDNTGADAQTFYGDIAVGAAKP
jgi:hypothetical protein